MMHVVCDLETTGVNCLDAEIITGYFIAFDEKFDIKQQFSIKSCPRKWYESAEMVHGISYEQARKWPEFSDVFEDLWDFFESNKPDAFWCHAKTDMFGKQVYFDHAILRYQMLLYGDLPYYVINRVKPYSTLSLAKITDKFFNFEGFSLNKVCNRLNIELEHHNAKSDCEASYKIIKKLLPYSSLEELQNFEQGVLNDDSKRTRKPNRALPTTHQSIIGFI
jgi:DNA polymerase III epsilon subunit-like protein